MNIPELIKEAHDNAIERGFYDCQICHGDREIKDDDSGLWVDCQNCDTTGINPNKNIGELLMLIISELGEALEAHRCGRFVAKHTDMLEWIDETSLDNDHWIKLFEINIKNTFEDELADVFIRLFDLCGYLGIEPKIVHFSVIDESVTNMGEMLFCVTKEIVKISDHHRGAFMESSLDLLDSICEKSNIPIEKYIKAKMAYNRTRPRKHGKEY